jgi:hypothetical protein
MVRLADDGRFDDSDSSGGHTDHYTPDKVAAILSHLDCFVYIDFIH